MAETLLADGRVVEAPRTFRLTITLPFELKAFIDTRAAKYGDHYRDQNASAYTRDLILADRARLVRGNGKVVRRAK